MTKLSPAVVAVITSRNANVRPEHPAIIFEGSSQTFAEHAQRVYRLVNTLFDRGLQSQDRVAILAENCPEYLEAYAACEVAGFIACPINYRLALPEMAYILKNIEPRALIFDASYTRHVLGLSAVLEKCTLLELGHDGRAGTEGYETALAQASPEAAAVQPDPEDAVYIIHTSGTTGRPKGAVLGQGAQYNLGHSIGAEAALSDGDRGLISQPLFHVGAKFLQLAHHAYGATVYLHRGFAPSAVWHALRHDGITTMQLVPTMLAQLLSHDEGRKAGRAPQLHTIFYSTAPIRQSLLRRGLERFGQAFLQQYGSTESGPVSSLLRDQHATGGADPERLCSAGQACAGVKVRIVDEAGDPCSAGQAGEIEVQHRDLMLGYWRDPDATADAFHGDWFRMGDIGLLDDQGFLFVVDRKQDMIVSGGENIYPREVEVALETHSAVEEAAVIGIPNEVWGEDVFALVVFCGGGGVTEEELIEHCRASIAGYKVPKRIEFISSLPRVPTGKIDKAALRRPFWADRQRRIV